MLCTIVPNVEYKFMKAYFNCLFHGLNAFGNRDRYFCSANGKIGVT